MEYENWEENEILKHGDEMKNILLILLHKE
jgi:hypothetical protein